jgi:CubicO group peptidase (beta-lactamase class C family)
LLALQAAGGFTGRWWLKKTFYKKPACASPQIVAAKEQQRNNTANNLIDFFAIMMAIPSPESVGMSGAKLEDLRSWVRGLVESGEWPCAAVLVASKGQVVFTEVCGFEDMRSKKELQHNTRSRDTLHRIYSMTKPIMAVAVLLLVEEKKLTLDDPLGKHIPAFDHSLDVKPMYRSADAPEISPAKRPPTIKDLLQHRAGVFSELEAVINYIQGETDIHELIKNQQLLELVSRASDCSN